MSNATIDTFRLPLWFALAAGLGAVTALVFAGWMRFGPDILLSLTESGLNLCI